jgi:hypothetical protein
VAGSGRLPPSPWPAARAAADDRDSDADSAEGRRRAVRQRGRLGRRYHSFVIDITVFHNMLAYIMAPERRDGEGWGRQAPGAQLPPSSPSAGPSPT